jgi:NAD+ synthase (glutamine-hydrolysing)
LLRNIEPMPFVPNDPAKLTQRCLEILDISVAGLIKRLQSVEKITGKREVTIGLSGGRDSILALLKIVMAFKELGWDLKGIKVYTMPGFGTTKETYQVACDLAAALGVSFKDLSIVQFAEDILEGMGHELPCNIPKCLKCQNIQARLRKIITMTDGFDIGTGNMSEAYHGYCTYGADQLSMYNPNCSDPKTLVNFLIQTIADSEIFGKAVSEILYVALKLLISAELIRPNADGTVSQITEQEIGPYNLLDFIMFDDLRNMFPATKIFFLASWAYDGIFEPAEIFKWLESSYKRFYGSQFKRQAVADGVKTGSVSVDPRGDMRRPADMLIPSSILEELDNLKKMLSQAGLLA